jgi:hypothetical protein
MRAFVLILIFLMTASAPAWADTAAGLAAYDKGDFATALRELTPAAESGDAVAQSKLGVMLAKGEGVARDPAAAVEWFRKSAAQGDPEGQYNLGVAYDVGETGASDPAQAMFWYRKSAEQGYVRAQYNLGHMMVNGGDPAAHAEGAAWTLKAAEQGMADAMHLYGTICGSGTGVSQNLLCARYWLERAAKEGAERAPKMLKLTEQAISELEAAGVPKTAGGDGSTPARAILMPAVTTTPEGVRAEHQIVAAYFRDWKWSGQGLDTRTGPGVYDQIELLGPGGKSKTIYFDITNWFGKME